MGIYDAAKDAANVLKEAGKIAEYQKILDLIDDLFQKREEIEKLNTENKELRDRLKTKEEYEFKNNSYWNKTNNDGPFCSRCFDKNKDLIRIIPRGVNGNYATCPECHKTVNFTGRENSIITRNYYSDSNR